MSKFDKCLRDIRKFAGDEYSDDDLNEIFSNLDKIKKQAEDKEADVLQSVYDGSDDELRNIIDNAKSNAVIAANNIKIIVDNANAMKELKGRPKASKEHFKGTTVGTEVPFTGSRLNPDSEGDRIDTSIKGNFYLELKRIGDGAFEMFTSGDHDVDILDSTIGKKSKNPTVNKIADTYSKAFLTADKGLARFGIILDKLLDRFFRTPHNKEEMLKTHDTVQESFKFKLNLVRKEFKDQVIKDLNLPEGSNRLVIFQEVAFRRWRDMILPLIDKRRTFKFDDTPEGMNKFLKISFDKLTDNFLMSAPKVDDIADSMTRQRKIHFKDSSSAMKYANNQGFKLHQLFDKEITTMSKNIALLKHLGNNPNEMLDTFAEMQKEIFKGTVTDKQITKSRNQAKESLKFINGTALKPIGTIGDVTRVLKKIADLKILPGVATRVLITDQAAVLTEMGRAMPEPFENISTLTKVIHDSLKSPEETDELSKRVAVFRDSWVTGSLRFGVGIDDHKQGTMMRLANKLAMHHMFDFGKKTAIGITWGKQFAAITDKSFDELSEDEKRYLNIYGIKDEWNLFKSKTIATPYGRILPADAMERVSDNDIAQHLKSKGIAKINKARIDKFRDEFDAKLQLLYKDRIDHGVLRPDAGVAQLFSFGANQDTVGGRLAVALGSLVRQFSSYEVSLLNKTWAQNIYGKGAESFYDSVANGKADFRSIGRFLNLAMMLGMVEFKLKQAARKGQWVPFEPKDIFEAAQMGSVFGIYNRFADNPEFNPLGVAGTFTGVIPSALIGTIDNLYGLAGGSVSGKRFVNTLAHNWLPINNVWANGAKMIGSATGLTSFNQRGF